MNKILLGLICGVMILGTVTGCGQNSNETDNNSNSNVENNNTNTNTDVNTNTENNNNVTKKTKTLQIPGKYIYADYDIGLRRKENPYTVLVVDGSMDWLVGVASDTFNPFNGNLEDVPEVFKFHFVSDASLSLGADIYGNEYSVKSTEKVKIGNRDSIKFIATVKSDNYGDCYIVGYAFIIDEIPIAVIGIVGDRNQSSELIEKVNENVEQISKTLRTTK